MEGYFSVYIYLHAIKIDLCEGESANNPCDCVVSIRNHLSRGQLSLTQSIWLCSTHVLGLMEGFYSILNNRGNK